MTAGLLAVLAGFGVLAWYMQRRDPPELRLSFARLLQDPLDLTRKQPRFSWVPPTGSLSFWLHMAVVALCIAAIWTGWTTVQGRKGMSVGLRVVLDVSHSMSLPDKAGTRLDAAREIALAAREAAVRAARAANFCDELVLAGAGITSAGPLTAGLAVARTLPEGGEAARLLAAAALDPEACPVTHVLVVSDLPRPAQLWPGDAPVLIWRQVGQPLANAGLLWVRFRPSGLVAAPAVAEIGVGVFGGINPPVLQIRGPDGTQEVTLLPSLDRLDLLVGRFQPKSTGAYRAVLVGGGAYSGDDSLEFDLDVPRNTGRDWRLEALPPPPGTRQDQSGIVVAELSQLVGQDGGDLKRPIVATYPGWKNGGSGQFLGSFIEGNPLLDAVNMDVLERFTPQALRTGLPDGFSPVLTDAKGGILIAQRKSPPGFIVPHPVLRGDPDLVALSTIVFFTALRNATDVGERSVLGRWRMPDGTEVTQAWKESDTAKPVADPAAPVEIVPRRAAASEMPVWPWMLAAALVFLMFERGWAMWRVVQGGRHVL